MARLSQPGCPRSRILALRHELFILRRFHRAHKPQLTNADRILWAWLSGLWSSWRSALVILKPETVIAWHRRGFRLYWSWKSRHPQGRPSLSRDVIDLIRRMSLAKSRGDHAGWRQERTRLIDRMLNSANSTLQKRQDERFVREKLKDIGMIQHRSQLQWNDRRWTTEERLAKRKKQCPDVGGSCGV